MEHSAQKHFQICFATNVRSLLSSVSNKYLLQSSKYSPCFDFVCVVCHHWSLPPTPEIYKLEPHLCRIIAYPHQTNQSFITKIKINPKNSHPQILLWTQVAQGFPCGHHYLVLSLHLHQSESYHQGLH